MTYRIGDPTPLSGTTPMSGPGDYPCAAACGSRRPAPSAAPARSAPGRRHSRRTPAGSGSLPAPASLPGFNGSGPSRAFGARPGPLAVPHEERLPVGSQRQRRRIPPDRDEPGGPRLSGRRRGRRQPPRRRPRSPRRASGRRARARGRSAWSRPAARPPTASPARRDPAPPRPGGRPCRRGRRRPRRGCGSPGRRRDGSRPERRRGRTGGRAVGTRATLRPPGSTKTTAAPPHRATARSRPSGERTGR